MKNEDLIKKAKEVVGEKKLSKEAVSGEVGAALVTDKGNVYVGVSLHAACGIGSCGEHTAIGAMLTAGESRIEKIVALCKDGVVYPCGVCRELMYQVDMRNAETDVVIDENKTMKLKELLPMYWQ